MEHIISIPSEQTLGLLVVGYIIMGLATAAMFRIRLSRDPDFASRVMSSLPEEMKEGLITGEIPIQIVIIFMTVTVFFLWPKQLINTIT